MPEKKGKLDRFCATVARRRTAVLLIAIILTVLFSLGIFKIRSEVILQDLFPYDHPYLQLYAKFSKIFGSGGSGVVIAVRAKDGDIFNPAFLGKIKTMTNEIELWDEVYRLLTVSMASNSVKVVKTKAKGEITIEALMFPDVPKTTEGIQLLKKHIFSNPSYNGTLVSSDGTAALLLTEFKENISYEKAFTLLHSLVQRYEDGKTSIHIVGYPMMMGWIYSLKTQMYWVFAISIGLMVFLLFMIFRNLVGMIAPITMTLIWAIIGLGFTGFSGINFSPLLYVLAFLVGARMLSNAVQITHRYIEEFAVDQDKDSATYRTIKSMLMPNAASVATDVAGFSILAVAKIVLMQQLAVMMSFWMLTIVISGVLVPVICSFLPIRVVKKDKKESAIKRGITAMSRFSITSGKYAIMAAVVLILVAGVWKTTGLKVGDPTQGSPILWPDHRYNRDQELINKSFNASSENLVLYYEGQASSVYDPIVMETFEKFDQYMAEKLPDIYKSSSSVIDSAKALNLTLHDGDQIWYQMPRDEFRLTGLLGFIRNTLGSTTLARFIDGALERAQITIYFADHTSDNMLRVRDAAHDFFSIHAMKTGEGEFKMAGGRIGMEIALNEEMMRAHVIMDSLVLFVIFIMCTLAFRSFVAGAMLAFPLILSNLIAFSYMAIADIGLSTGTLPCSAVGVGVGVDFAIYFYSRCSEEYGRHDDWRATVLTAARTAGEGVVFTGLTLILPIMAWYLISDMKFQAQMGFFLSMLLSINLLSALTLHPLMLMWIRPKFITRKNSKKQMVDVTMETAYPAAQTKKGG